MSEVLYRKWRPRSLREVMGQDSIVQTLLNAVSLDRLGHAYLFCGPRGTGKTSTARILAKAVNCLAPSNGEPDNRCRICSAFNEGKILDLIEIDAASNRRIDDIRDLESRIWFTPNECKYKVYIIDEVHMLTEHAFNALLKTLEEPPPHAILILATTDIHKVPATIISRCQRFDFKRIAQDQMMAKLILLCKDESVEIDDDALRLICGSATGSLRDAENILEQVIISCTPPITSDNVRDLLGMSDHGSVFELAENVIDQSLKAGLQVINDISRAGQDIRHLHRGVTEIFRSALLIKAGAFKLNDLMEEHRGRMQSMVEKTSINQLTKVLRIFSKVELEAHAFSTLPLEIALVETVLDDDSVELSGHQQTASVQHALGSASVTSQVSDGPSKSPAPQSPLTTLEISEEHSDDSEESSVEAITDSSPEGVLEVGWSDIIRRLRRCGRRFMLGALLHGCKKRLVQDEVITLLFRHRSHIERVEAELADPAVRKEFYGVFNTVMGKEFEITISIMEDGLSDKPVAGGQIGHLVRAAEGMGARVLGERILNDDE